MADNEVTYDYDGLTDMYKVTLSEDGFTASCWVSSMHLIDEKKGQLRDAIRRMALDTMGQ